MMWFTTLALLMLIIYLIREQGGGRRSPDAHRGDRLSPLDVLDRRYAAGELTTEEYKKRKKRLLEDRL